ncbi:MAG: helix-turn-helix domain-containing protein [Alphaproteobacteria bacterium]|nr:helix-turn-helix domain-containing protein [Alphaproteobacteria bacterium]
MYQDAFDALAKLGLKRDEAKVYLACLRNKGGLFVHEITTQTKVKRSTVDLILRRLTAKNVLSSVREGARHKFLAESPERVLFDVQKDLDDFRSVLPMLMRLGGGTEQTRVTFHEGAKGIQAIYNDVILTLKALPEKDRINYCVSSGREIERIQPRFRKQFIDRRIQDKLWVHMIAVRDDPHKTWPSSKRDMRFTKMFDGKKYPFQIEMNIYNDKVMFISTYKPAGGVIIQNKTIAHSLRSFFQLTWDMLGKPEPDEAEIKSKPRKR